jgi:hypothetical protein
MTIIIATLALLIFVPCLPMMIKGVAFILGMSVIMLCPSTRTDLSPSCQSCHSEVCPITVLATISLIFIVLPIVMLGIYVLKPRKNARV